MRKKARKMSKPTKEDKVAKLERENAEIKQMLAVIVEQNKRVADQYSELMKLINPPAGNAPPVSPMPPDIANPPGGAGGAPGFSMPPGGMSDESMKKYFQIEILRMFSPLITNLITGQQNVMGNVLMESQQRMMMENFMAFQMYQRAGIRRMAQFGWLQPEEMKDYEDMLKKLPVLTPTTQKLQNLPNPADPQQGVKPNEPAKTNP